MGNLKIPKRKIPGYSLVQGPGGHLHVRKIGMTGKRIKTDPKYERARENFSEFGRAGANAKMIRQAFSEWMPKINKVGLSGRMTKAILSAIKADEINHRGNRSLLMGKVEMLEGFNFNIGKNVKSLEHFPLVTIVDHRKETLRVQLNKFVPGHYIVKANKANCCRLVSITGIINYETGEIQSNVQKSTLLEINDKQIRSVKFINAIISTPKHLNFLALGIEFSIWKNGEEHEVSGGEYDPLTIMKVVRGLQ